MPTARTAKTETQVTPPAELRPKTNSPLSQSHQEDDAPLNRIDGCTKDVDVESDEISPCICGTNDPGKWIECDNMSCLVGWYHLDCVGLKKPPVGDWICPRCRPIGGSNPRTQARRRLSSAIPVFPNLGRGAPAPLKKEASYAKGVAIKKVTPKKEKPRWKGWVEVSSTVEDEFKRKVEEPWAPKILPQQRRSSTANYEVEAAQLQKENEIEEEEGEIPTTDEESLSIRITPRRRRSNAKSVLQDALPQEDCDKDNGIEEESTYDTDDSAMDETEDEGEMRICKDETEDDHQESPAFENDTASDFKDLLDDEDSMDYTYEQVSTAGKADSESQDLKEIDAPAKARKISVLSEPTSASAKGEPKNLNGQTSSQSTSRVSVAKEIEGVLAAPSPTSPQSSLDPDDDLSGMSAASFLVHLGLNTGVEALSEDSEVDIFQPQSNDDSTRVSASSEGNWVLQYRAGLTGRYPTLGERSTLPRLG